MDYQNKYFELGDYAHNLIRCKARALVGKAGFTSADCEDIEQELALDLLVRLDKYDPKKSKRNTFMTRVVEHCIASLIAKRQAACRDWRLCRDSLDEPLDEESDLGSVRIDKEADPSTPTSDDLAREMDIQNAVMELPDDLRELWTHLLDSNMHRASREMGIPRSTLYSRLERLREALREAGL